MLVHVVNTRDTFTMDDGPPIQPQAGSQDARLISANNERQSTQHKGPLPPTPVSVAEPRRFGDRMVLDHHADDTEEDENAIDLVRIPPNVPGT